MAGIIELTGQADFPACACCGMPARRVWGNLIDDDGTTAYVVQWAPGSNGSHAAVVGLVFGPWGEGSDRADRCHLAIETRLIGGTVQIMAIDAATSPIDATPLAATAMSRDAARSGPLLARAYNYVEQIRAQDARVMGLTSA